MSLLRRLEQDSNFNIALLILFMKMSSTDYHASADAKATADRQMQCMIPFVHRDF